MTRADVADLIERFVEGGEACGEWEWDDFTSCPIGAPELEDARLKCVAVTTNFPPSHRGHYCSEDGVARLLEIANSLRD